MSRRPGSCAGSRLPPNRTPTRRMRGQALRFDGGAGAAGPVEVAEEVPVNLVYATLPHAVMMATPADLEDFAYGFSLTEGVVAAAAEIRGVAVREVARGIVLEVDLVPAALRRHMARLREAGGRSMAGRTGCGICGIESLEQLPEARPVAPGAAIAPGAIRAALLGLEGRQVLNRATRAVHAAAWCDAAGGIVLLREDVGRHNALDKLVGACLRAGVAPGEGFVLLTSRASFEMVEKAASFGAGTVVAISAPTSLAVERAAALGIALVAVARPDGAVRFTPGEQE
jgi:FdhD protein